MLYKIFVYSRSQNLSGTFAIIAHIHNAQLFTAVHLYVGSYEICYSA